MKNAVQTTRSNIWRPFTTVKEARDPLPVKRGYGTTLELEDGRKVLDCISSWWVTLHGHGNHTIAEAIYEQAKELEQVIFADFTHAPARRLSEKLLSMLPSNLGKVFFSDNGSTSVEVALKTAYQYWVNKGVKSKKSFIAFEGAYHGDTMGAMSVSAPSDFSRVFEELLFSVTHIPYPATFCGDEEVEKKELKVLSHFEELLEKKADQFAAIILEPLVQGAGGMRMCRPEFLRELQKVAHRYHLLVIYDEVMTGFGRTGDIFACRKAQTHPDLICLSKGITGGTMPLAVTVCSDEIYKAFASDDPMKTFWHGHSYTANPVGCAAALASFNLLQENHFTWSSMEEKHLAFLELLAKHERVARPRVCGTISAMDIVTEEADGYMNQIGKIMQQRFMDKGIYLRPLGNTLYLMPPYCIKDEELEYVYGVMGEILSSL
ncbi:MAG: adenosylmethionine--8-amino-7-oxononanoate transaminase [Waddliaceae bacterium]|nr:adenosylmethionine--8-amino-7-oxononanoate transaminase [Waddliaceae bacterium]